MADTNKDFDIVPLLGCGPWMVGRDHFVNPVPADYETQFVVTVEKCCNLVGPAPFEYVGNHYIGRALLVIPNAAGVLKPGDTLFFDVRPGWNTCCGVSVAKGSFVVPSPAPECIELVQIDGLMHQSLRLLASSGAGGGVLGKEPVPWRWQLIECCTERRVTYGPGVTPGAVPP